MLEYEYLKQNDLFSTIKRNNASDKTIAVFVRNVRSLLKHLEDTVSDDRIINNDIIGFTITQINLLDSTFKIIKTLIMFSILILIKNENKFLSLANGCRNDVDFSDKFDVNRVSIFSFKEHAFANKVITSNVSLKKTIQADARNFSGV